MKKEQKNEREKTRSTTNNKKEQHLVWVGVLYQKAYKKEKRRISLRV